MNLRTLIMMLLLASLSPVLGEEQAPEQWTNRAGQTLRATPVNCTNGHITFRLETGTEVTYPLTIFPENEAQRLKLALGICDIPAELKNAWTLTENAIRRIRAFRDAGHTTDQDAETQITALRSVLLNRITTLPDLTDTHRKALQTRAKNL